MVQCQLIFDFYFELNLKFENLKLLFLEISGSINQFQNPMFQKPCNAFQAVSTLRCSLRRDHQILSATTGIAAAAVVSGLQGQPIDCAALAK